MVSRHTMASRHTMTIRQLCCAVQRKLFSIGSEQPGDAATSFTWNSKGTLLAIGGKKVCKLTEQQMACPRSPDRSTLVTARWLQRVVTVYDRNGALRAEISIPAPEFPYDERLPCINQLQVRPMRSGCLAEQQLCAASCKPLQIVPEQHSISHQQVAAMLQWDSEGDLLAVLPRGQGFALVWTAATAEVFRVEAGLKVTPPRFLYTCCTT